MPKQRYLIALFVVALLTANANSRTDQFTPLVASALTANARPFPGTDGRLHIVYELVLTNTSPTPATLTKIEVQDPSDPSNILASYTDQDLLSRLRMAIGGAPENATIEFSATRLFLIDLALDEFLEIFWRPALGRDQFVAELR